MEMLESLDEIAEEAFPPRPGGLVDRHRQRKAAEQATRDVAANEQERIEEASFKAVKVAPESPEVFSPQTFNIPVGGKALILPKSAYRYRGTVLLVTAASTVILAKDEGQALGQNGGILPSGVVVPLFTRAQVWAFNNSDAPVQLSVFSEIYAPEA